MKAHHPLFLKSLFILSAIVLKVVVSKITMLSLRQETKDIQCTNVSPTGISQRFGWLVSSLLGEGTLTYNTISIGAWIDIYSDVTDSFLMQFMKDYNTETFVETDVAYGATLAIKSNYPNNILLSLFMNGNQESHVVSNEYQGKWAKVVLLHPANQDYVEFYIETFKTGKSETLRRQYTGERLTKVYPNLTINTDYATGRYTACTKIRDLMFHYSIDEEYSGEMISNLQFYRNALPIFRYDYRIFRVSEESTIPKLSQQIKNLNIYSTYPDSINGESDQIDAFDVSYLQNMNIYQPIFYQNQYMTTGEIEDQTSIVISFYLSYYITDFIDNQETIIFQNTSNSKFKVSLFYTSPTMSLKVMFNTKAVLFNPIVTNRRITLSIRKDHYTQDRLTVVFYYDKNLFGTQSSSDTIDFGGKYIIGNINQVTSTPSFQIYHFSFFTNAILTTSDDAITETEERPSNCFLYVSAGSNLLQSYCLACTSTSQVSDSLGKCTTSSYEQPIRDQPPIITELPQSQKAITLYSRLRTTPFDYNFQSSSSLYFMVIGYIRLTNDTQFTSGKHASIFRIESPTEYTTLFHLLLMGNQSFRLKIYLDTDNMMESLDLFCIRSILNEWIIVRLSHDVGSGTTVISINETQPYAIVKSTSTSSGRVTESNLRLRIVPDMTGSKKYSTFGGETSTMKFLISPDLISDPQSYLQEKDGLLLSQINPFDTRAYLDQLGFIFTDIKCPVSTTFFEGICITDSCDSLVINSDATLGVSNTFYMTTDSTCNPCPANCLKCEDNSGICISCSAGKYVVNGSCKMCAIGTYLNPASNTCVADCDSFNLKNDITNRICVGTFDPFTYTINPILVPRFFISYSGQDSDFQTTLFNLPVLQCWIDSDSFYSYSFLTDSSNTIAYTWQRVPAHYKKSITFILILLGQSSDLESNVVFLINSLAPSKIYSQLLYSNSTASKCTLDDSALPSDPFFVYEITLELIDNHVDFILAITWNNVRIGVRNLQPSVSRCSPSCISCSEGGASRNCQSSDVSVPGITSIMNSVTCEKGKYQDFQNCYTSPCYKCTSCRSNCLSCEDITGNCIICETGYQISNGDCIASSCDLYSQVETSASTPEMITKFCLNSPILFQSFFSKNQVRSLDNWQIAKELDSFYSCNSIVFLPLMSYSEQAKFFLPVSNSDGRYRQYHINLYFLWIGDWGSGDQVTLFINSISKITLTLERLDPNSSCFSKQYGNFEAISNSNRIIIKIQASLSQENQYVSVGNVTIREVLPSNQLTIEIDENGYSLACVENASVVVNDCVCNYGYYYSLDYVNARGTCVACSLNCENCSGPSAYDCLTCAKNFIFSNKICIFKCPDGTYQSQTSNTCIACHSSCLSCSGPEQTQCTSCYFGNYFYNRRCYSSCSEISSTLYQNEWKRTCESNPEQVYLTSFFKQSDYFADYIVKYVLISDSLDFSSAIYACNANNILGLFTNKMQFYAPIFGPHQAVRVSFKIYAKCSSSIQCNLNLQIDNDLTTNQSISFQPTQGMCEQDKLLSLSLVLPHETTLVSTYQINFSSTDLIFGVSEVQISTIICHPTCKTCKGPLISDCTSCISTASLDLTSSTCVCNNTTDGFGVDDESVCNIAFSCYTCLACISPCSTCFKVDSQSCNSCISSKFLFNKICIDECPINTTIPVYNHVTSSTECQACPFPCEKCNSLGLCLSCLSGYLFISSSNSCVLECPKALYYQDKNTCLPCSDNCEKCTGSLESECKECSSGFYMDNTQQKCKRCYDSCSTCSGPQETDCIECLISTFPFTPIQNQPELFYCTITCSEAPGYFLTDSGCQKCYESCSSCTSTSSLECLSCNDGYYYSSGSCLPCNDECSTCSGGSSDDCLSCIAPLSLSGSLCKAYCPRGLFSKKNISTKRLSCVTCPAECTECTSEQNCTACTVGYSMLSGNCSKCLNNCDSCVVTDSQQQCLKCSKGFFVLNQVCYEKCPSQQNGIGYYGNILSRSCKLCDSNCKTCEGPYDFQCESCSKGSYLNAGTCYQCPSQSTSCFLSSETNLLMLEQCAKGYNFYEYACYEICPIGTYQQDRVCYPCDAACRACTGPSNTECIVCSKGYIEIPNSKTCVPCSYMKEFSMKGCVECSSLYSCSQCESPAILYNGVCVFSCPPMYYLDSVQKSCRKCVFPCKECTASTTCTSCGQGYFLSSAGVCSRCNPICTTCSGGSSENCLSCASNLLLQKRGQISICLMNTCDSGYYVDEISRTCIKCDDSCKTCNSATECSICAQGYFKANKTDLLCTKCVENCSECSNMDSCTKCTANKYLQNGKCITDCPVGFVGLNNVCVPCKPECANCSGTPATCTKCPEGSYLLNSRCPVCQTSCSSCTSATQCSGCISGYFLEDGSCKLACENEGYYSDRTYWKCKSCDSRCKSCSGPFERQCTSCATNQFLQQTNEDPLNPSGQCQDCHASCAACFGPRNTECTSCINGVKYKSAVNTCIPNLSSHYYDQTTSEYKKCSALCKECTGPYPTSCISCPDKYYLNVIEGTCTLCPDTCQKCSQSGKCTACLTGYVLVANSQCVDSCPKGMQTVNGVCLCHSSCAKCSIDSPSNSSICTKCAKSSLYLNSISPSCITKDECEGFTDEQTNACVSVCPDNKYQDDKNRSCSSNPCTQDKYTVSGKYCVEVCPDGTYADEANRICKKCNSKCRLCFGSSDSECYSCAEEKFYHEGINACRNQCMIGYIVSNSKRPFTCTVCEQDCKICKASLFMYEKQCVEKCPIGYIIEGRNCKQGYSSEVRIKTTSVLTQKVSIEKDLEISAELYTIFPKSYTVNWKCVASTDSSFPTNFSPVSSSTLVQFVPYLLLSSGNKYTLQIQVQLTDGTILVDEISFETLLGIKVGQFVSDKTKGESNVSEFMFSFSGWDSDSKLFFSLNFYELIGLVSPGNFTTNTASEYMKSNIIQLYEHTELNTIRDTQISFVFPPFEDDIHLIAELFVHNSERAMKSFSYILIELTKFTQLSNNPVLQLTNGIKQLSSITNQLNVLQYSLTLKALIPLNQSKYSQLKEYKNLRVIARRMSIPISELADCDQSIDCFGNGICITKTIGSVVSNACECDSEYTGFNCEISVPESQIIIESASQLISLIPQLTSSSIRLQVLESLMTYASFLSFSVSNSEILQQIINLFQAQITVYLSTNPEEVTAQLISRSISKAISVLQSIGLNSAASALITQKQHLEHLNSKNLNVGESLLTSSDSCDSLLKPLFISSKTNRVLSSSTSSSYDVTTSDLTISFPPEVVENNKKQVVQVQKWKQPSRSNPNAISQSVSISLSQSGSEVSVNNLSTPIIFTLPKTIPSPVSSNPEGILCTYFDESTSTFSSEGCTFVKETITEVVCSCIHLTEFQAAINPSVSTDSVTLTELKASLAEGKKIILANQPLKQAIKKLPTIKLGKRSVSVTSQMYAITKTESKLLKQVMILTESEKESFKNYDFTNRDEQLIELHKQSQSNSTLPVAESSFQVELKYLIVYVFLALSIALILSIRALPKFQYIDDSYEGGGYQTKIIEGQQENHQQQKIKRRMTKFLTFKKIEAPLKPYVFVTPSKDHIEGETFNVRSERKRKTRQPQSRGNSESIKHHTFYKISIIEEENSIDEEVSIDILKERMSVISLLPNSFNRPSEERSLVQTPSIVIDAASNQSINNDNHNNISLPQRKMLRPSILTIPSTQELLKTDISLSPVTPNTQMPSSNQSISQGVHSPKSPQSSNSILRTNSKRNTVNRSLSFASPDQENITIKQQYKKRKQSQEPEKYENEITENTDQLFDPLQLSKSNVEVVEQSFRSIEVAYKKAASISSKEDKKDFEFPRYMTRTNIGNDDLNSISEKWTNLNKENSTNTMGSREQRLTSRLYLLLQFKRNAEEQKLLELKLKEFNLEIREKDFKRLTKLKDDEFQTRLKFLRQKQEQEVNAYMKVQKEIEAINKVKNGIDNQIQNILGITSSNIFQVFFLVKSNRCPWLFSDMFTKSFYLCTQVIITILCNIVIKDQEVINEKEEINYEDNEDSMINSRVIVSMLVGYAIPFFFFGLLTHIFVTLSNQQTKLTVKLINSMRAQFTACYLIVAFLVIGVSIAGVVSLEEQQLQALSSTQLIKELILAFIGSNIILDGISYLLLEYFKKNSNHPIIYFFACRGYYYYEDFDNPSIYSIYFENKFASEISATQPL